MTLTKKKDNWKICDVNNLAAHFHSYNKKSKQHDRLGALHLKVQDIDALFKPKKEIESFAIHLAIDWKAPQTGEFNFRPVVSVKYKGAGKRAPVEKLFQHGEPSQDTVAEVPFIFKEWLSKNWMELDTNLIDDVFTASFAPEKSDDKIQPVRRTNKRLMSYFFSETANPSFFEFITMRQSNITQFVFHLGVDMNKYNHKEHFSFSPIIEVRLFKPTEEILHDIHLLGLRSYTLPNDEEVVYTEYLAPCPSTCP